MMRLKGIKLPSKGVVEPTYSNNGQRPQRITNYLHKYFRMSIETSDTVDDIVKDSIFEDILVGVVRAFGKSSTHKGMKINAPVVRSMLDKLPELSQLAIMDNYGYGRQQASRYLQACRIVSKAFNKAKLKNLAQYST